MISLLKWRLVLQEVKNMLVENIPGTNIKYGENKDAFSILRPMIEITGGLSLGQICSITNLQPSTIQNWVKRSYVPRPINKKYHERHVSRILLISALRDSMNIEEIGELMILINGDTEDESDDIISESNLFDYFCRCILKLDESSISNKNISEIISKTISDSNAVHLDRLKSALTIMIYAYILGECKKQINKNLYELRGKEDEKEI